MNIAVVTRHPSAVRFCKQFIQQHFNTNRFDIVEHLTETDRSKYDIFIGVIPAHIGIELQQKGKQVYYLALPDIPKEFRGRELSIDEMIKFGAYIYEIGVIQVCDCNVVFSQFKMMNCPTCGNSGASQIVINRVFPEIENVKMQ